MDYSVPNRNGNQIASATASSGTIHQDSSFDHEVPELRHGFFDQNAEPGIDQYEFPQIGTPMPMRDNNNAQHPSQPPYSYNENVQQRQNFVFGRGISLPSSSDIGMRTRTGRGVLPPRLPESSTGNSFNVMNTGNGDMDPYTQVPIYMVSAGNGRSGETNMGHRGRVGNVFRRSPVDITQYDNQNGFSSGQHHGMPSKFADTSSNMGNTNNIFQHQGEVDGWTRDQNQKCGDSLPFGHPHGQFFELANDEGGAPEGSDTSENSNGTVGSPDHQYIPVGRGPTAIPIENLAGKDRTSRSRVRGLGGEPMSSSKFKGHSGRALHRVGMSQQTVEKPLGRRSKGAKDPENIEIVDWYDNHEMSFAEIAQRLNSKQEKSGRPGSFTPNSIHNRYNRCAPIIYRAEGRVFVPIRDRKKHAPEELDAMGNGSQSIEWTPQKDQFLRRAVEDYEANKWPKIAAAFTAATRERVGPGTVSTRFGLI